MEHRELSARLVSWLLGAVVVITVAGCASAKTTPGPAATKSSAAQSRVVSTALKHVGAPYARGGSSPAGFDCSGFVMFVYARAGLSLPHSAEKQYRLGSAVPRDELQPGDIVFFDRLGHSGIYIGNARFVHATKPGDVVKVSRLDEDWYRHRWVGARRLL
jgi:cell wall-associated NlpC family hydrolase